MSAEAPASGQLEIPRGAEANVGRAEPRRLGSATSLHWSNARRGLVAIILVARLISTVITKHDELETRLAGGSNTTSIERCRFGRSCSWRSCWGCTGSCSRSQLSEEERMGGENTGQRRGKEGQSELKREIRENSIGSAISHGNIGNRR